MSQQNNSQVVGTELVAQFEGEQVEPTTEVAAPATPVGKKASKKAAKAKQEKATKPPKLPKISSTRAALFSRFPRPEQSEPGYYVFLHSNAVKKTETIKRKVDVFGPLKEGRDALALTLLVYPDVKDPAEVAQNVKQLSSQDLELMILKPAEHGYESIKSHLPEGMWFPVRKWPKFDGVGEAMFTFAVQEATEWLANGVTL